MATVFSNVNLVHMNRKQLQVIARFVGVANVNCNEKTVGTLITAIKAK